MSTITVLDSTGAPQTAALVTSTGQTTGANSLPVVIASDQSAVPTTNAALLTALGTPLQAGGNVAVTASALPTGAATATGVAAVVTALGSPAQAGATQAISAAALPLPAGAATATGVAAIVTALGTPTQAGATQAISAASLPLPTGAATAAKQPALGAAATAASTPVNIASDQTVPVSAASLPLPTGAATATGVAAIVTALGTPAQAGGAVSVSNFPATQPVSATALPLPTGAATSANQTNGTQVSLMAANAGAAAAGITAIVDPVGQQWVSPPFGLVFTDPFNGPFIDANQWIVTTGGTGSVTQVGGSLYVNSGTTALGFGAIVSKPSFAPKNISVDVMGFTVQVESPLLANKTLFFGKGTVPAIPTTAVPITDGFGFYLTSTTLSLITFAAGVQVGTVALPLPVNASQHVYGIMFRGDTTVAVIDNYTVPVGATIVTPGTQLLPLAMVAIAGATPPSAGQNAQFNLIALGDSGHNANQISDGTYPWINAVIKQSGIVPQIADNALVVALSPNSAPVAINSGNVTETNLSAAQTTDAPIYTVATGDPQGDFAGINVIEQVATSGSGLAFNVLQLNPPASDQTGILLADGKPISIFASAVGQISIIDTTGYDSLNISCLQYAGTVTCGNDLSGTWVALSGTNNAIAAAYVTAVAAATSYCFPCLTRYIRFSCTTTGAATAYLRAAPWQPGYLAPIAQNVSQIAGVAPATLVNGGAATTTLSVAPGANSTNADYAAQAWAAASGSGATITSAFGPVCSFFVNVTAWTVGSSTGLDIFLQWSPDNGTTWFDLWQVEAFTAVASAFIPPINIPGRRRFRWVNRTGAATTATVSITAMQLSVEVPAIRQWFDRTANVLNGTATTPTAAYDIVGCKTLTCTVVLGAATTAGFYQMQLSNDSSNWASVGTATQGVASASTSFSVTGVAARFARAIVTTGATAQTGTYVAIAGCN